MTEYVRRHAELHPYLPTIEAEQEDAREACMRMQPSKERLRAAKERLANVQVRGSGQSAVGSGQSSVGRVRVCAVAVARSLEQLSMHLVAMHRALTYHLLTSYYTLLTTAQGGYYALLELGFQPAMEMAEVVAQQRDAWLEEEARTAALVLGQRKASSK